VGKVLRCTETNRGKRAGFQKTSPPYKNGEGGAGRGSLLWGVEVCKGGCPVGGDRRGEPPVSFKEEEFQRLGGGVVGGEKSVKGQHENVKSRRCGGGFEKSGKNTLKTGCVGGQRGSRLKMNSTRVNASFSRQWRETQDGPHKNG